MNCPFQLFSFTHLPSSFLCVAHCHFLFWTSLRATAKGDQHFCPIFNGVAHLPKDLSKMIPEDHKNIFLKTEVSSLKRVFGTSCNKMLWDTKFHFAVAS